MGRGRRRNRRGAPDLGGTGYVVTSIQVSETLSPTFVSMPWSAESDMPVLPLEGIGPNDQILGPSIIFDEAVLSDVLPLRDSDDPTQLELAEDELYPAPDARAIDVSVLERPLLVLEAEPFDVERRAAPREPDEPAPATLAPLGQIELTLPDAEDPGVTLVSPEPAVQEPLVADLPFEPTQATADALPGVAPATLVAGDVGPEAAAAIEPVVDPLELRVGEARAAAGEGRLLDARTIYREVVTERPTHLAARNNLALLLEQMGDSQGALVEYDRALEVDGGHATLLANRGALLGAMGRYAAAERDLKKVLRVEPAHLEALFNLGVVMTRKGLWSEAVPQLRRAVEIDPTRGSAYFYLGEALNKIDDLYGAMAAYQRAAELLPDHPRALYGLGIVYDRLGRPDDAARMYRRSREVGKR